MRPLQADGDWVCASLHTVVRLVAKSMFPGRLAIDLLEIKKCTSDPTISAAILQRSKALSMGVRGIGKNRQTVPRLTLAFPAPQ